MFPLLEKLSRICTGDVPKRDSEKYVRQCTELFPSEVPGVPDEVLTQITARTSPMDQVEDMLKLLDDTMCRVHGLAKVYKRNGLSPAMMNSLPERVRKVVDEEKFDDSFVTEYAGQEFTLMSDEMFPNHAYDLILRINSGGAYWKNINTDPTAEFKVELLGPMKEGTNMNLSQGAVRGAVFIWRWRLCARERYTELPTCIDEALRWDGDDPVGKLRILQHHIEVWETNMQSNTEEFLKKYCDSPDNHPDEHYLKFVLNLWPTKPNPDGSDRKLLKACTWIEGGEPSAFCNKKVILAKEESMKTPGFVYVLKGVITQSKPLVEDAKIPGKPPMREDPPYRLTTTWSWAKY